MTTITDVEDVFQEALDKLQRLSNDNSATPEQRQAARDARKDLLLQHGSYVIQSIDGRTAILSALVAELEQVVSGIKGADALSSALDEITGVLKGARQLYEQAKAGLADA